MGAYRATRFCADTPRGRLVLRIDATHPALDALLDRCGARTWAYVTAYNPRSERLPDAVNRERQEDLTRSVTHLGLPVFHGEGVGPDPAWPPEPSLLILGITRQDALALGRRFGQYAIVFGTRGGVAELVGCGAG